MNKNLAEIEAEILEKNESELCLKLSNKCFLQKCIRESIIHKPLRVSLRLNLCA